MGSFGWGVIGSLAGVASVVAAVVFGVIPLVQQRRRGRARLSGAADRGVPGAMGAGGGVPSGLVVGLVVVGDVPREPPAFQRRAHLLEGLEARAGAVVVVRAVTGQRGVGKTQVAAAYTRSRLTAVGQRLVAWVEAGDLALVAAGLAAVAARLGLPVAGLDAGQVAGAVRRWLEADGQGCLLVFDNVTDVDGLRSVLPAGGLAQVIVTSNRQAAGNLGQVVAVDVFSEREALAFLAERTGLADEAGAQELGGELGWLPLGLAQAAAVIAGQGLSYGEYLGRLRSVQLEKVLDRVAGDPYPHRVAEAIVLSLAAAGAADRRGAARMVLDLVAVSSEAGVPRSLLRAAAATWAAGGRKARRGLAATGADEVLGGLAEWSLVTFSVDGSVVTAHRLVMRVVRERCLADGTFAAVVFGAVRLLAEQIEDLGEPWRDPAAARALAEQITALHEHGSGTGNLGELAKQVMLDLRGLGIWLIRQLADDPALEIKLGRLLVTDLERVLGVDHPSTLTSRNDLASAYESVGRLDEAITLSQAVLTDRQRVLGPDHPSTLTSRNNLASAYESVGRLDEAITLYQAVLTGSGSLDLTTPTH